MTAQWWTPPPDGSVERLWWERGAESEESCHREGITDDQWKIVSFVHTAAKHRDWSVAQLAAVTADVFTAGNRRARWRLAWRLIRTR